MSYDTNTVPPRPWFCGYVYLKEAKNRIDSIPTDQNERGIGHVTSLVAARLNIMRGIRTALQLPPENYDADDILMDGLEEKLGPETIKSIKRDFHREFRYRINGTGQWNYPDFAIKDKLSPSSWIFINEIEGRDMISKVVDERLEAVNDLMNTAMEIFFWDVYVPLKQKDIHYYDNRENMDCDEILEKLVDFGFAEDIDKAEIRYADAIDSDPCNLGNAEDAAFRDWQEEEFCIIVSDNFWNWEEDESIFHSFSD